MCNECLVLQRVELLELVVRDASEEQAATLWRCLAALPNLRAVDVSVRCISVYERRFSLFDDIHILTQIR